MKLTDIVELAKQGYKPADIKELISLSEDHDPKSEDPDPEDGKQKAPVEDQENDEPEGIASKDKDDEAHEDDVDYRSLYEAEKKKTSKLQKMIAGADMSGSNDTESDNDIFASVMKDFM